MKKFTITFVFLLTLLTTTPSLAWLGMPTPPLHIEGRFLKDPSGKNVLLHGWMQPIETWFNGGGSRYRNPTNWEDPNNIAGMLNYLNEAATVMSDTTPKYGRDHGWYASFVRINTDFIGGWTQEDGLVSESQFNGWIQNFIVPYANHLKSRGLYLVVCATGPMMTPNNGAQNAGVVEQQRLRTFWSTMANAPGVKNADNIMFELMNEPVQIESSPGNGQWGSGSNTYFEAFRNWMQPVIDDVRATGANNVIWVPCLGWQGEPHGWDRYPFTGSNIGIAAHYYPAYGGVYDNATSVQNLWNRNYKPAADRWPMIITEAYWFPGGTGYDDLFRGTTNGFGNALKNAMDNQGNVNYLIGFIGDHLEDLSVSTPENTTLGSRDATQAYFSWLPDYAKDAPTNIGGCSPTFITPYIQVNNGLWEQVSRVTVKAGDQITLGPQPEIGGEWSWTGCSTAGSDREQIVNAVGSCTATATYTNACGTQTTHNFNVAVSLDGTYSFIAKHSGKALEVTNGQSANGTNLQQIVDDQSSMSRRFKITHLGNGWHKISSAIDTLRVIDVSGVSTANGANIHVWSWLNENNQQWKFEDVGEGHVRVVVRHSNKCLDVEDVSLADGANIHQWECVNGAENQAFKLIERNGIVLSSTDQSQFYGAALTAYPNPFSEGGLHINQIGSFHYQVIDLNGVVLEEGKANNQTTVGSNLNKGVYGLIIQTNTNTSIQKIIKQ